MPKQAALSGADLDWKRELCNQGCREWIPWYENRKGKTVYGCRLGVIPRRRNGQSYCQQRKPRKPKRRLREA